MNFPIILVALLWALNALVLVLSYSEESVSVFGMAVGVGLACIASAASWRLAARVPRRINLAQKLMLALAFVHFLVSLVNLEGIAIQHSVLLVVTIACLVLGFGQLEPRTLAKVLLPSCLVMAAFVIYNRHELLASITVVTAHGVGRGTIGGMHVNLFGNVGLTLVMVGCLTCVTTRNAYVLCIAVFAVAIGMFVPYAASSRGALIPSMFCCLATVRFWGYHLEKGGWKAALISAKIAGVISILVVVVVNFEEIWTRLELSGRYRGLDSGMTGRTYIWADAFRYFQPSDFIVGLGLRQGESAYGHALDSTYLNILLDAGVVGLVLFLSSNCILAVGLCKSIWFKYRAGNPEWAESWAILVCLVSVAAQNFIGRGGLAVGNPYSIFALVLYGYGYHILLHGGLGAPTSKRPPVGGRNAKLSHALHSGRVRPSREAEKPTFPSRSPR